MPTNQQPDEAQCPANRGQRGVDIALAAETNVRITDAEPFAQHWQVCAMLACLNEPVGQAAPVQLAQHRRDLNGLGLGSPDDVDQRSVTVTVIIR